MREHRILRWCDACAGDDGDRLIEAVETFSVAIVDGEQTNPVPKVLDLCAEHAKALIAPLSDLLALTGQLPEPKTIAPQRAVRTGAAVDQRERIACEICGTVIARASMVGHVSNVHLEGMTPPGAGLRCPVCGDTFPSSQGTAMHRYRMHGRSALDDMYAIARSKGILP